LIDLGRLDQVLAQLDPAAAFFVQPSVQARGEDRQDPGARGRQMGQNCSPPSRRRPAGATDLSPVASLPNPLGVTDVPMPATTGRVWQAIRQRFSRGS
jgi:hypothetical protein